MLEAEPDSIERHVELADLRAQAGKGNLARHSYRQALRIADDGRHFSKIQRKVIHARAALEQIEAQLDSKRRATLAERGFPDDQLSPRFREAVEIAAGRLNRYVPEPTDFYYPGLPIIQFFETAQFPWAEAIQAAAPEIREELKRELDRGTDEFRAYLQGHSVSPEANKALLGKRDWSVLSLCENGWVDTRVLERFPRTWQAIQQAPLPAVYGWGPTVVFSKLAAGAHIAAHNGMFNTRLICHLPLIVPPGCRFRVGNQVREWKEGELLIFDDTIEHEAWNDGTEDRVVLIFDVWRPELTEVEKEELGALFHA